MNIGNISTLYLLELVLRGSAKSGWYAENGHVPGRKMTIGITSYHKDTNKINYLRSPAGKAHPFKGGMKGGLAFFLKA